MSRRLSRETRISLLAAWSAVLTLALGYASSASGGDQAELLVQQVSLSGEYVDLILSRRLARAVPVDEELLLAKEEEVVRPAQQRIQGLIERIHERDRGILGLTVALVLLQLRIVEETLVAERPLPQAVRWTNRLLYWAGMALSVLSILWLGLLALR